MIRTCRLFFPVRNNYNVSLLNQRTCQAKQTSIEFSFYTEQWKDNYAQRKLCETVKSDFSTFKEREKIELEINQQKKSKDNVGSDYLTFKQNKILQTKQTSSSESDQKMNIDCSTFKKNFVAKPVTENTNDEVAMGNQITSQDRQDAFLRTTGTSVYSIYPSEIVGTSLKQKISSKDAIKGLKILVKSGKRPIGYLNFLSRVLMLNCDSFDLIDCSDILFACAKLTYTNLPLFDLLSKNILQELSREAEFNSKVLISLLQSFCILRYRNCKVIENLAKHVNNDCSNLSAEQITGCLFALSNINMQSVYVDNFINVLSKLKNTDFNKTKNFLNYVWASVILKKEKSLPLEHLELVLSKRFIEQLAISGEYNLLNKIKLSNISGVASNLEDYKGPLLENLIFSPVLSKSKNDFLGAVRDSLSYIFPKTGFLQSLSYAGAGVFIDIECCLDTSSNPVQLKHKENNYKIGIVLLDHKDLCLENQVMTGINAFKLARIKSQGYETLCVFYTEFPLHSALSLKIAYLREKLAKVLVSASKE